MIDERLRMLAETWNPPYELTAFAKPRPVKMRSSAKVFTAVFSGFGVLLMAGMLMAANNSREIHQFVERLAREGVRTEATVTSKGECFRGGCVVHVAFEVAGQRYWDAPSIPKKEFDRVNPGSVVPITYLPSDPRVHRLDAERDPGSVSGFDVFFLVPFIFVGLFPFTTLRERRILREGDPTPGIVLSLDRGGKSGTRIKYEHLSPYGKRLVDSTTTSSARVPSVGDVVTVLTLKGRYDLYPLDLVEIAKNDGEIEID